MVKIVIVLALVAGAFYWFNRSDAGKAPTAAQINGAVSDYLIAKAGETCSGSVELERLSNIAVRPWNAQLQAWPVTAEFAVRCNSDSFSKTWVSGDGDSAVCLAQAIDRSRYSCGLPGIAGDLVREAERGLQESVDKAIKSMPK